MSDTSTDSIVFTIDVAPADGAGAKINALAQVAINSQNRVAQSAQAAADAGVSAAESAASRIERQFNAASAAAGEMAEVAKATGQAVAQEYAKASQSIGEAASQGADSLNEFQSKFKADMAALSATIAQFGDKVEEVAAFEELKNELEELGEIHDKYGDTAKKAFGEAFEGSMDFVKGLAQVGVLSEENSEGMLRGLVAIEATYNTLKGGYEVVSAVSKGLKAFTIVKLADNEITAKTAKIEALRIQQLQQEVAVASRAAGANYALATARGVAGKAAGPLGSAVGSAGSAVASTAAGAGVAGAGAAATGAASGSAASGTIFGIGAGVAATTAVVTASIAALGATIYSLGERVAGTANQTDSFTYKVGEMELAFADFFRGLAGYEDRDQTEKLDKRRDDILARRKYQMDIERIDTEAQSEIALGRVAYGDRVSRERAANTRAPVNLDAVTAAARAGAGDAATPEQFKSAYDAALKDAEKIAQLQQQAAVESNTYQDAMRSAGSYAKSINEMLVHSATEGPAYANALKMGAAESERAMAAAQKMRDYAREAGSIQISAAERSIDLLSSEIDKRRDALKDYQDASASAAERFAALDEIQQAGAIDALNRGRAGQELSKEDRSLLRSVGGDEAMKYARSADIADARAAGFDQSFGAGFGDQQRRLQNEITDLEARLNQKMEVKVTLQADIDGQVKQITGTIEELMRYQNEQFTSKIQASADEQKRAINDFAATSKANRR